MTFIIHFKDGHRETYNKMKTYTYYIESKKRCAETVTIEAPS